MTDDEQDDTPLGHSIEGTKFRSRLERDVAEELDAHGIRWMYEQPVVLPEGERLPYLPDFLIDSDPLRDDPEPLPQWIEGKPQEFLYDLRDSLGVTRRHGDRFAGVVTVETSASDLRERHIEELWKPKRLAEVTGQTVWVIGGVGGVSRLSVAMTPTGVEFTRENWLVNAPGYAKKRQREIDRQSWIKQQENVVELQRQASERAAGERSAAMRAILASQDCGQNRIASHCAGCGQPVGVLSGHLFRTPIMGGGLRWFVVCQDCGERAW